MKSMWDLWRTRKALSDDILTDLLRSRERSALGAISAMQELLAKERHQELLHEIARVNQVLRERQSPFRDHTLINDFLSQFDSRHYGAVSRFRFLVLIGPSVQGKTSKGMSLFPGKTFKVCCGACATGVLPSLSTFDRAKHRAILFDEIRPDIVLKHREVFQANSFEQTLGQSVCNAFSYDVWVYHIAFILCANEWDMTENMSDSDREWLESNQILVTLPVGEKWYLDEGNFA